jgi:hypothetical protein
MLHRLMLVPVLVLVGACAIEPAADAGKEKTAKAEQPACDREAETTGTRIRRCNRDSSVNVLSPADLEIMRSRGSTGMVPGAGGR